MIPWPLLMLTSIILNICILKYLLIMTKSVAISPLMDCIYIHKMVYLLSFQVECGLPCCSWKSHFRSPLVAEDINLLKTSIDVKLNSEIFKKRNPVPWIWRAISHLHFCVPMRGKKLTFMCTFRVSCVRYISWKSLLD